MSLPYLSKGVWIYEPVGIRQPDIVIQIIPYIYVIYGGIIIYSNILTQNL